MFDNIIYLRKNVKQVVFYDVGIIHIEYSFYITLSIYLNFKRSLYIDKMKIT